MAVAWQQSFLNSLAETMDSRAEMHLQTHYQRDPVQTTKTSVHGAINMLGLAKRVKAKILQASTGEVYGDPPTRSLMDSQGFCVVNI
jgi:GDP-D-mannose dehydratase